MSLVSNQVPVFEAYRGGKIYFLVVCDAVLVFILAEDEIATEIMSFPQFVFSLESKAALLLLLLLSVHSAEAGGGPPVTSAWSPWVPGPVARGDCAGPSLWPASWLGLSPGVCGAGQ